MTVTLEADERLRRETVRVFWENGLSTADAARALGMPPDTLRAWVNNKGITRENVGDAFVPREVPEVPVLAPREVRDAAFWRRKADAERERAEKAEHLAELLAGIRATEVDPPEWMVPTQNGEGRATLIVHTSDWHMGEVVNPGEIDGMNAYSPEITEARMRRMFEAAVVIGGRWMDGSQCDGVLLTLAGDLTSGDIHEELMRTNALTSHEQIARVVEIADAGIKLLLDAYKRVHVVGVPGNHGRTTHKPTAKLAGKLSYDILAVSMLRERFKDDKRVTWSIPDGPDVRLPLYGRTVLVTHGDKMGTGGGQGFAGPVLPIIRGGNKVRLQSLSANRDCDLVLMGHYHTSAAPPGILANGSVVGYSEFGNQIRASVEPPKQWLARFSHKWGLCERLDVQLDEAPKQRMRFK